MNNIRSVFRKQSEPAMTKRVENGEYYETLDIYK
jgi:hypothetical protein